MGRRTLHKRSLYKGSGYGLHDLRQHGRDVNKMLCHGDGRSTLAQVEEFEELVSDSLAHDEYTRWAEELVAKFGMSTLVLVLRVVCVSLTVFSCGARRCGSD